MMFPKYIESKKKSCCTCQFLIFLGESFVNKFFIFLYFSCAFFMTSTHAESMKFCNEVTTEINKEFPARIDKITTIKSVFCFEDRKKANLVYNMSIDLQGAPSMDQKILNSMRQNISNSLCTDPDLKDLLQMFPVSYSYYFDNGKYIGKLEFSIKQCK